MSHGENGQLTLDKQGLEAYRKLAVEQQSAAAAMVIAAKQEEGTAKEQQASINLFRAGKFDALGRENTTSEYMGTNPEGSYYGEVLNEEAVAQTIQKAADFISQHQELRGAELEKALSDAGIASGEVAKELADAQPNLLALGQELQSNTTALEATTQAYASQINSQSEKYLNADAAVQNMVDAKTAEQLANASQSQIYQNATRTFDQNTD